MSYTQAKHNRHKKSKNKERSKAESQYLLLPLFVILTILPLVLKVHTYNNHLSSFSWGPLNEASIDIFLFGKQWIFVIIAIVLSAILLIRALIDKKTLKFSKLFLPLFVYGALALLSSIFSEHKSLSFIGSYDQFENVFCLLGYVLVAYYAYLIIQSESELTMMIHALAYGALILGIIGSFQAFGLDYVNSSFFHQLIESGGYDPASFSNTFKEGRVFTTLFNPNYVGVYCSLILPTFVISLFFAKKLWERILYGLVIITNIICLFGSQSKAGLISIIVSMVIVVLIIFKKLLSKWYLVVPGIIAIICTFFIIDLINDYSYSNSIKQALAIEKEATPDLENFVTHSDHVSMRYKSKELHFYLTPTGEFSIKDDFDAVLPMQVVQFTENSYDVQIQQDEFAEILVTVLLDDGVDFGITLKGRTWYFGYDEELQTYLYLNRSNRLSPIVDAPAALFTDYPRLASGRGYLWSRTIPLLKNNLLLGSGADTFITEFPQYDFVDFYNYDLDTSYITKPHSLYLQIGVQTGVLSLLAFLLFYGIYFVQSIKLYFKNQLVTISSRVGLAIFIGTFSYMISGITNDSTITVAPVFWTLLGTGIAANMIEKRSLKTKASN